MSFQHLYKLWRLIEREARAVARRMQPETVTRQNYLERVEVAFDTLWGDGTFYAVAASMSRFGKQRQGARLVARMTKAFAAVIHEVRRIQEGPLTR